MAERLATEIADIVERVDATPEIKQEYLRRIAEGLLTRDENPQTHYCVYFAGFSPEDMEVFIGHHKKSGLWLFNGGHIDKGETANEALLREIREEWGTPDMPKDAIGEPQLLTITKIDNPKQTCKTHYDIWYFIRLDKNTFNPDRDKLAKEFHETRWASLDEARKLITDPSTLEAIDYLEESK